MRFSQNLFSPISLAPLVYFRIAFGLIMLWEVWRYFDNRWIHRYYIRPEFYFTYPGFDWVHPLPGDWMYVHFYALGALAICIAIGLFYRVAMPLFFLGFTYVFLLDQTNYLNHFYLVSLITFLLIFVPAHRTFSVDIVLRPRLRSHTVPAWTLRILQFQIAVVYFYGAIAKLNSDWLQGEPMRLWLADSTGFPLIGRYFTEEWMVYAFSYGGIFVDGFALPLFYWRRTRWLGFAVLVLFHLTNHQLFSIGIFPWFMLATLPLFVPLSWWERIFSTGAEPQPALKYLRQPVTLGLIGVYCLWQILMPLRHFIIPGDVNWTEEGHYFSWHMKLRDKEGIASFRVYDPISDQSWLVQPKEFLTNRQVSKMPGTPDMVLLFAHYLADVWRQRGYKNVEVYAVVLVSLNGRPYRPIVDASVNLAAQPRNLLPANWIVPLDLPLKQSTSNLRVDS